jgi:gluconate 2-dehydrogenase gamma chain
MSNRSRRTFLRNSVSGLGAAWLASNWPGILAAQEHAQQMAAQNFPTQFAFFTPEQAAEVAAMASAIIPTDDTPGAREAGCIYFIDSGLTTFLHDSQALYTQGVKDLQAKTQELFPGTGKLSELTSAQQIQALTAIEKTQFFTAVRNHTIIGMFASPKHGGNQDEVGWKLIGFEDTMNFKAPFGYYDAASNPRG